MTDDLKPCPFCGGPAKAYFAERIFYTTKEELWSCECINDNAQCMIGPGSEQIPYDDMVAAWNCRPAEEALAAERDALRALVSDGLDLCVKGRVMDQHDGNLPLWIVDGYTAELTAWEAKARAALNQTPAEVNHEPEKRQ